MPKTVLAVFVKLLFCLTASAQTNADSTHLPVNTFFVKKDSFTAKPVFLAPLLPADFYTNHLPFFCATELKIEKATRFPVKFRLGSVEYCDKLEGKNQR